jgi:hypothetical protein
LPVLKLGFYAFTELFNVLEELFARTLALV